MFGLGFSELLVLAVIILVLIGPQQLPDVMKGIAKFVREMTDAKRDFTRTLNQDDDLRRARDSVDEVKSVIQNQADKVKKALTHDSEES